MEAVQCDNRLFGNIRLRRRGGFIKHFIEAAGGGFLEAGQDVAVSIDSGADVAVAEAFADDFGVDACFEN